MLFKCSSTQYAKNLENSAVATRLEKVNFHSVPEEGQAKYSNYCTFALISHASKVMFRILHTGFQQYMSQDIPDIKAGFRNSE